MEDSEAEPRPGQEVGDPGAAARPKLRRRLFGYRPADVDEALDARVAELAELRQDIAALWLAFAQHDRMIRDALQGAPVELGFPGSGEEREQRAPSGAPETAAEAPGGGPADGPAEPPAEPAREGTDVAGRLEELGSPPEAVASIGQQLSDLDEVLAAIELATRTLEATYVDEIGKHEVDPPEQATAVEEERSAKGEAPASDTEEDSEAEPAEESPPPGSETEAEEGAESAVEDRPEDD